MRVIHQQTISWWQSDDRWIRYTVRRVGKEPIRSRLRYPSTLGVLEWLSNTFVLDGWKVPAFDALWRRYIARTQ